MMSLADVDRLAAALLTLLQASDTTVSSYVVRYRSLVRLELGL